MNCLEKHGKDEYGLWTTFTYNGVRQVLRWIKPGKFMMGSPESEPERHDYEHEVILTEGFWIAETACTQELWEVTIGENPSHFKERQGPVDSVSWNDCKDFLGKINICIKGLELCLPTEEQWEYACRAGTTTDYYWGTEEIDDDYCWYYNNSSGQTHPVKQKKPNGFGLYDMSGNVLEWCENKCGSDRVLRGGCLFSDARDVRSAARDWYNPQIRNSYTGFRLSRGQKTNSKEINQ